MGHRNYIQIYMSTGRFINGCYSHSKRQTWGRQLRWLMSSGDIDHEDALLSSFIASRKKLFDGCLASIHEKHKTMSLASLSTNSGSLDRTLQGDICGDYIYYQQFDSIRQCIQLYRQLATSSSKLFGTTNPELVLDLGVLATSYLPSAGINRLTLLKVKPSSCQRYVLFLIEEAGDSDNSDDVRNTIFLQAMPDAHHRSTKLYRLCISGQLSCDSWRKDILNPLYSYISDVDWSQVKANGQLSPLIAVLSCQNSHRSRTVVSLNLSRALQTVSNLKRYHRPLEMAVTSEDIALLFDEPDETCFVDAHNSKDNRFLFIHSQSKTSTAVYHLDYNYLNAPIVNIQKPDQHPSGRASRVAASNPPAVVAIDRIEGVKWFLDHIDGGFIAASNAFSNSNDLRLLKCKTAGVVLASNPLHWDVLWPPEQLVLGGATTGSGRPACVMTDYDLLRHGIVVYSKLNNRPGIHLLPFDGHINSGSESMVSKWIDVTSMVARQVQSPVFQIFPASNVDSYLAKQVRFAVSNPLLPELKCQLNMDNLGQVELLHETAAKTACSLTISPDNNSKESSKLMKNVISYFSKKTNVSSKENVDLRTRFAIDELLVDGCVPLTMVRPTGTSSSNRSPRPTLLVGYGAYGSMLPLCYTIEVHELLERGWNVAFAHVRGGGELGAQWHESGKGFAKPTSFLDYAKCAQYLIDKGYTTPKFLCGLGGSAGGLLVSAMVNQHPHLFAALVLRNPFVDVMSAMTDSSLPLTQHEFAEWGNPITDWQAAECIRSYCPVSVLQADTQSRVSSNPKRLPKIFISIGLQDTRVCSTDTMRFARLVRKRSGEDASVLMSVWRNAGHDGPHGDEEQHQLKATEVAFLVDAVDQTGLN